MKPREIALKNTQDNKKRLSKNSDTVIKIVKRSDFLSISSKLRAGATGLNLQAMKRPDKDFPNMSHLIRIGFTCSRKVGNAVRRNAAKRRLRHVARECIPAVGKIGWDYVVIGRYKETEEMDFNELKRSFKTAIKKVHTSRKPR
jgi:ribonuclease P protein component